MTNSNPLCQFKNAFGLPNQGIHQYRVLGLPIIDFLVTIIIAFFISWIFRLKFWVSLIGIFILGEIVHIMLCVDTAFLRMIGLSK